MVEDTLRRIVWVFPDRESRRGVRKWQATFWLEYAEVARELGLQWSAHAPDDVVVDCLDADQPRVWVAGEPVTPADTLFVTSLYSLPYQAQDVFNQYALYAVLEQLGFYLPSPPYLSAIVNDKLATLIHLRDAPVPPIPTVRVGPGRDLGQGFAEPALGRLDFPVIVKPTGWCSGWGICMAHNLEDVRGVLSLAQGGETTLVCQPYLGPRTVDYRVYLVDGEPLAMLRRTPRSGAYVGNLGRGGSEAYVDLPAELATALPYFARKVPIPLPVRRLPLRRPTVLAVRDRTRRRHQQPRPELRRGQPDHADADAGAVRRLPAGPPRVAGGAPAVRAAGPGGEPAMRQRLGRLTRDFHLLWAGETIGNVGDRVTLFVVPTLMVFALGASAFDIGLVSMAQYVAIPVLSLVAGALVDRWDVRRLLIACDLVRAAAVVLIPIAYWQGFLCVPLLFAVRRHRQRRDRLLQHRLHPGPVLHCGRARSGAGELPAGGQPDRVRARRPGAGGLALPAGGRGARCWSTRSATCSRRRRSGPCARSR